MIHCYQMNGYNIILDVHSGGVHVVDELFYRLAQEIEPPLPEVPDGKIRRLWQGGGGGDLRGDAGAVPPGLPLFPR